MASSGGTDRRGLLLLGCPPGSPAPELAGPLSELGDLVTIGGNPPDAPNVPHIRADLASWTSTAGAVAAAESRGRSLGALVTLPPAGHPALIHEIDDDLWRSTLENTLTSSMHLARASAPRMAANGSGSIVLVTWRVEPGPARSHLAAVAQAVMLLGRALAAEVGPSGIRVNAVAVPPEDPRAAIPAIELLVSSDAGYLTGEVLYPRGEGTRWGR